MSEFDILIEKIAQDLIWLLKSELSLDYTQKELDKKENPSIRGIYKGDQE